MLYLYCNPFFNFYLYMVKIKINYGTKSLYLSTEKKIILIENTAKLHFMAQNLNIILKS